MNVRVAALAAGTAPDTGQSRKEKPFLAASLWTSWAESMSIVEESSKRVSLFGPLKQLWAHCKKNNNKTTGTRKNPVHFFGLHETL